jgi:phosphoglycerate dehydrogenase-like enzyme
MIVAMSPFMATLVGRRVGLIAPEADIRLFDAQQALKKDAAAGLEVLFFSSDLIESSKQDRRFDETCRALAEAKTLRWVQSGSSGYERPIFSRLLQRRVRLSTGAGIHTVPMAQYVLSHMLAHVKRHRDHAQLQRSRRWEQLDQGELTGMTIGIVGLGAIGTEIARLSKAFGMRVLASKRTPSVNSDVDEIYAPERLKGLIAASDFVVITVPHTPSTERLIDATLLTHMKHNAVLINIARGAIIDELALLEGLRRGTPAAAVLDVTAIEPLPTDSPLWSMPSVTITPHDSAWSPRTFQRLADLFCANLDHYLAGRGLINEVHGAG